MITTSQPDLATYLRALEIPDCGCDPFQDAPPGYDDCPLFCKPAPCCHVQARDHKVGIDEWAAGLFVAEETRLAEARRKQPLQPQEPNEYLQPPMPTAPALAISREHRIDIMAQRRELGLALWHPGDSWITLPDYLANESCRLRNGSAVEGEAFVESSDEEPDVLPWEEKRDERRRQAA